MSDVPIMDPLKMAHPINEIVFNCEIIWVEFAHGVKKPLTNKSEKIKDLEND